MPDNGDGEGRRDWVLSQLRMASTRAEIMRLEINTVGVALKGGLISPETAVEWISDVGAAALLGMVFDAHADAGGAV